MVGNEFDSLEEFLQACRERTAPLAPEYVIGKVYLIQQVRRILTSCGISAKNQSAVDAPGPSRGVSRRYQLAQVAASSQNAECIGEVLSQLDHEFHFPLLTYFRFPDVEPYISPKKFLRELGRNDVQVTSDFVVLFNGMTQPPGRSCELESIRICDNGDTISLLFSCTRVLVIPERPQSDYRNFFLARIPVVVKVLFRWKLIEISMPYFSESAGLYPNTTQRRPERFQTVIQSGQVGLGKVVPYPPRSVSYGTVTLYLETHMQAVDMGWRIEPSHEAAFDLTQKLIPLKKILDNFSQSLASECSRRGLDDPLAGINLYDVFRALKEQSRTYSLVLQVPLGSRRGMVFLSTLYGQPNSGYEPLLELQTTNASIAEHIRHAVNQSHAVVLENPYDLSALFAKRGSNA